MESTLATNLSSTEYCRRAGWRHGTLLESTRLDKEAVRTPKRILITEVPESGPFVMAIDYDEPFGYREAAFNLRTREWREIPAEQFAHGEVPRPVR